MRVFKKLKKHLLLFDLHVPYHNKVLTNKVLKLIDSEKFDSIVLGGDFLDCYAVAQYNKNSLAKLKSITLGDEYDRGNVLLDRIDHSISSRKTAKVFLFGNHEYRVQRFVEDVDNAKLGTALIDVDTGLNLRKRGYRVYRTYTQDVHRLGQLNVIHGLYTSVHCAKKHLEVFNYKSVVFGHAHIHQTYRVGDHAVSVAIGGLFDKDNEAFHYANFQQRQRWSNSFAVVYVRESDGSFWINVVQCIDDSFVYDGKLW